MALRCQDDRLSINSLQITWIQRTPALGVGYCSIIYSWFDCHSLQVWREWNIFECIIEYNPIVIFLSCLAIVCCSIRDTASQYWIFIIIGRREWIHNVTVNMCLNKVYSAEFYMWRNHEWPSSLTSNFRYSPFRSVRLHYTALIGVRVSSDPKTELSDDEHILIYIHCLTIIFYPYSVF